MKRRTRSNSERKQVQHTVASLPGAERYEGQGIVIGTSKILTNSLNNSTDELRQLVHRLMYGRVGSQKERMTNIFAFCGFETEDQLDRMKRALSKRLDEDVTALADLFKLDKEQEDLADAVAKFFNEPTRPEGDSEIEFSEGNDEKEEPNLDSDGDDDDEEVYNEEMMIEDEQNELDEEKEFEEESSSEPEEEEDDEEEEPEEEEEEEPMVDDEEEEQPEDDDDDDEERHQKKPKNVKDKKKK